MVEGTSLLSCESPPFGLGPGAGGRRFYRDDRRAGIGLNPPRVVRHVDDAPRVSGAASLTVQSVPVGSRLSGPGVSEG